MITGDYEIGYYDIYLISFKFIIVLASNVILLSLIYAILGDVYEEVITIID